jgi:pimeloyl-ACP methyl ester carboxylesterase
MRNDRISPLFLWVSVIWFYQLNFSSFYTEAGPVTRASMVYDWNKVSTDSLRHHHLASEGLVDSVQLTPRKSLQWTPCFDDFTCTRLEVPLQYDNPAMGNTAIAVMRLSAQNNSATAENILVNQGIHIHFTCSAVKLTLSGGPGGSGVQLLMVAGSALSQLVGTQYNLIGFDPRGVNNSGPTVDCFPQDPDARATFKDLYYSDVTDSSSNSLENQYYASEIFGKWCIESFKQNASGQYVSTPAVAQDMLSYIKAEQNVAGKPEEDAKLWNYGFSYGTVLGSTFAALFPKHVGRIVVDGVLDAED